MKKQNSIFTIPTIFVGLIMLVTCSSGIKTDYSGKKETGSFTDQRDGKTYRTVKIGIQWIMAENLAYKPESGNYWAYDNNDSNAALFGYLYDWETAIHSAPKGWHLPSRKEWKTIQKALGAKSATFPQMEKLYPKLVMGGSSGLDMRFGGMRTCEGEFKYLGERAMFWNSDSAGSEKAMFGLNSNSDSIPHGLKGSIAPYVTGNEYQKSCRAYSVRLCKD